MWWKKILRIPLSVVLLLGALAASIFRDVASSRTEQNLEISATVIDKLTQLRLEKKYVNAPGTSFNGMKPEPIRRIAEDQLDALLDIFLRDIASHPHKRFVLQKFSETLSVFPSADTEDRERLLRYLEQIMDVLGIQNSDGLLNRWMYGPVLGRVIPR